MYQEKFNQSDIIEVNSIYFMSRKSFFSLFFISAVTLCQAQLRLPQYFADHAILQRDQPVTLWGWCDPGKQVSVLFDNRKYSDIVGQDSLWQVGIPPQQAGGPYRISIESGMEKLVLDDIYFGDVFFCSGQSNMQFLMGQEAYRSTQNSDFPLIRSLHVHRKTAITPQMDVWKAEWILATDKNLNRHSAVAYYFAKQIHERERIPVGIIHASWGASTIETFMDPHSLRDFPEARSQVEKITPEFVERVKSANDSLLTANPGVENPKGFINIENRYPTMVYNGMVVPFFSYPIKGVVWYQGEGNAFVPICYEYEAMLTAMINSWRASWRNELLPFFIVQLANYGKIIEKPESSAWAVVQEAQFAVSRKLENVRTAITNDIGDPKDIHPRNKRDVGKRLAVQALELIYGHTGQVTQGPVLKKATLVGNVFELSFENVGSGLVAKDSNNELYSFAIAGEDNQFYRARAEIKGDKVIVYSDEVPNPVYVRYAFESCPERINFYNKEGFPAVPFRTDRLKDAMKRA